MKSVNQEPPGHQCKCETRRRGECIGRPVIVWVVATTGGVSGVQVSAGRRDRRCWTTTPRITTNTFTAASRQVYSRRRSRVRILPGTLQPTATRRHGPHPRRTPGREGRRISPAGSARLPAGQPRPLGDLRPLGVLRARVFSLEGVSRSARSQLRPAGHRTAPSPRQSLQAPRT